MSAVLLEAATQSVISIEAARAHLRIDDDRLDTVIQAWIAGITRHAEHQCGRAFLRQRWHCRLEGFTDSLTQPRDMPIDLPISPVLSIKAITYLDTEQQWQTLAPASYQLDTGVDPNQVHLAAGQRWPPTARVDQAVRIDLLAGYGEQPDDIPPGILLYLLAKLVEQFDPMASADIGNVQSSFIDRLLDPYCLPAYR